MIALALSLLGIALLDSLNPSALALTLVLLAAPRPTPKVLTYLAGVFATYFACGAILMLGLGAAFARLGAVAEHPAVYAAQGAVGAALLLYASLAPTPKAGADAPRQPRSFGTGALFLLGVTVTAVEFSTALPYLGAIGLLTNANLPPVVWLPLLAGYNLIFILPPLLLLIAHRRWGARLEGHLARLRARLDSGMRQATPWVLGIIGFFLLADCVRYFGWYFGWFGLVG